MSLIAYPKPPQQDQQPVRLWPPKVTCDKEGSLDWTVRLNGVYVYNFRREVVARRIAMAIQHAVDKVVRQQSPPPF